MPWWPAARDAGGWAGAGGHARVGSYVVRVINYAAFEPWTGTVTFAAPGPHQPALEESRTLSPKA